MYRCIAYTSTFPAPWGDGFVLPEARTGTDAIAEALRRRGHVVSAVEAHKSYGFAFDVQFEGCLFRNVVNPIQEECYLTSSMSGYLLKKLTFRGPRKTFDRYCGEISAAFATLPEISGAKWGAYFG
jgi:hypothetical protein